MDVGEYLGVLRKRWLTIVAVALLGAAVAAVVTTAMPQRYAAGVRMFFSVDLGSSVAELQTGSAYTSEAIYSYAELVDSPLVLAPVIEDLGLEVSARELAETLSVTVPTGTVVLEIEAVHASPTTAADVANAVAGQVAEVTQELTPARGVVSSVVVEEAQPSTEPVSPRPWANLTIGLFGGLALGLALAVLREVTNTRVRNEADLASVTDALVLGPMGRDAQAASGVFVTEAPASSLAESIRRLRTNLQFVAMDEPHRSIVVTSSIEGEGKTTTAVNLAAALAAAEMRVLLVDADLRRPSVADRLGLEGGAGLSTTLIGRTELGDVVQSWGPVGLAVLPAGVVPPNPAEMLSSRAMAALLTEAEQAYDVVVIDAPPLGPVADAAVLSRLVDGAIVVAGVDRLRKAQLRRSLASLETAGARVLGIVLNKAKGVETPARYLPVQPPEPMPRPAPDHRHTSPPPVTVPE